MAYAVRRPVENVYLVRERDRHRSRELFGFALAAVPPVVVLFVAIWANVKTVELGYRIATVAKNRDVLLEKKRKLEMDRAQAAALSRVEEVSRQTLGLVPPTLDQVVLVKDAALAPAPPPARPPAARREAP
jgi:cell division protein FtsL